MIVSKLGARCIKNVWAGAVIVAIVVVVAGCDLPGAERSALPATPTPAARPAGARLPPATFAAGASKAISAAADRGSTPAARAVATPSPTATIEVIRHESSACTDGLVPMRRYASNDVASWTVDGSHILLSHNAEVWAVTPNGSRLWRIAQAWGRTEPGPGESISVRFGPMTSFDVTPDGKQVVYATCRYPPDLPGARLVHLDEYAFDYELAVVGLDGQAPRRLTRHPAFDNYPAWSPDGTRGAFLSDGHVSDATFRRGYRPAPGLHTMAADGADVRRLATGGTSVARQPPAWSPDGRSIVVAVWSWNEGAEGHELYLVQADGAGFVRLADAVSGGSWSPDGTRLAFAKLDGAHVALFTIAADGSDARRVTTFPRWRPSYGTQAWIHTVAWSPDGSKLLYSCSRRQFCVVTLDGRPVGATVTLDGEPVGATPLLGDRAAWSPDGARIAVTVTQVRDERIVLYSAAPDGSDRQPLVLRDAGLVAAQASAEDLATSRAACAAGFVIPAPAANPGLVRDCETLLAAREALFGGRRLVNWGSGSPLERWEGVTVTGSPPRVTGLALRLHQQSLEGGTIPPALGALDHLQALDLSGSGLDGPIPAELGQLTNLTLLDLRYNRLTGEIPRALNQLGKLKQLYLAGNRLTGCVPSGLKHLRDNDPESLDRRVCEPAL